MTSADLLVLRPLRRADIADLQNIDRAAHGEAWSAAAFGSQIENGAVRHLVAELDGDVVGHAGAWQDGTSLRITNVAVHAEAGGRGIATALLLDLLSDPRHADRIELEVRPANRRAQRLYSRFGFAPVGVERGFYDRTDASGSRDALVMAINEPHASAWRDRMTALAASAGTQTTDPNADNRAGNNEDEAA